MTVSNKKIVFTVTTDLSYDQRMQRICHSLASNGFEVLLIGRKKSDSLPLSATIYQQKRLNCWFNKGKLFYIEYTLRLFFLLFRLPTDYISSVDVDTLLPCLLVSKLRAKKCVFDAHEYFTEVPEVVNRPGIKKIWSILSNFLIPKVDLAYTVSQSLQVLFTQQYKTEFHLIRNISVSTPLLANLSDKHILLYQGALNEGRGLEALLIAIQPLEEVELWIAGEGDLSKELRTLATELKINHKVKFLGYLLPKDLRLLTSKATIGINLLENKGLSYYYSLANKTFDYIHAGLPAIHAKFPEYERLNAQYAIASLVSDLSPTTLQSTILQLINDRSYYLKLRNNCIAAAKVLNWEEEEHRLVDLYRQL